MSMESNKYCVVIPPITATSMGRVTLQKPETLFIEFGKVMEDTPKNKFKRIAKKIITISIYRSMQ